MITLQGQLSIRTVSGRNGDFNVGRLVTSIGEFVVKDTDLDQYDEGKYDGDFVIAQISPSWYSTNGRLIVENRATLGGMTLSGIDALQPDDARKIATQEVDPADEEALQKTAKAVHEATDFSKGAAPFGVDEPPAGKAKPVQHKRAISSKGKPQEEVISDEELFGILMPLGDVVKLDPTQERLTFRKQCARLGALGYTFKHETQDWYLDNAQF
ncbi:MAG: DUF3275 family protein [Saezia sp.]